MRRAAIAILLAVAACAASKAVSVREPNKPLPLVWRDGKVQAMMPDGGTLAQHRRWLRGGR